ncbi:hypothetical protein BGZ73_008447 [Actinomortierella ambigua]|nr:hypothetical protein BGZ73_008447 [Actinomortierella ambigua]
MNIPELRRHIAEYLDPKDRKSCALVCKAWHEDFQSFVWARYYVPYSQKNLPYTLRTMPMEQQTARTNSLARHAHRIRYLRYLPYDQVMEAEHQAILFRECRSLIYMDVEAINEIDWEAVATLIQENVSLKWLNLRGGRNKYSVPAKDEMFFAGLFQGHVRLREVAIGFRLSGPTVVAILEACPSLASFSVEDLHSDIDATEDSEDDPYRVSKSGHSHIKLLRIGSAWTDADLACVLAYCPEVECLRLNGRQSQVCTRTCKVLQQGRHKQLVKIALGDRSDGAPYQSALFEAVPRHQLKQVKMYLFDDGAQAVQTLVEHHHLSLESLRTFGNWVHEGLANAMGNVFFKCCRLRKLRLHVQDYLDIRYVIDHPWAFAGTMKSLEVPLGIDLQTSDPSLLRKGADIKKEVTITVMDEWRLDEMAFMMRLGQCHQLRRIRSGFQDSRPRYRSLKDVTWLLVNGLNYLAQLEQLEVLDLGNANYGEEAGTDELMFMRDHWPCIKKLRCAGLVNKERKWLKRNFSRLTVEHVIVK